MTNAIAISRLHFPVTTLGPGRRIGIWFQGCSIQCPGCISKDTWDTNQGWTTVDSVTVSVQQWMPHADGITISGGEPFDQPDALRFLLQNLRRISSVDVLVYSGYAFSELTAWLEVNSELIDVLISGPYQERSRQTVPLRGSDNQCLHYLTDLGRERFSSFDRTLQPEDRRFDVMFDDNGSVWIAGIPHRDDFRRFKTALKAAGHSGCFSDSHATEVPLDSILPQLSHRT
jgi:anaerobic ribonucleoside-triphosphate reductase activating protein